MIIAAAIKFHIDATDAEVVLSGATHCKVVQQLPALGFKPHEGYQIIAQGFIDNTGTFLDRKEAFQHALKCGQISRRVLYDWYKNDTSQELFSEDLW